MMRIWMSAALVAGLALAARADEKNDIEARIMTLICELDSGDSRIRRQAATQLGKCGVKTNPVVQALISALEDPDKAVRRNAVRSLGMIGPKASKAVPALKQGVARERLCPCSVDHALKKIGNPKDVEEPADGRTDAGKATPAGSPALAGIRGNGTSR